MTNQKDPKCLFGFNRGHDHPPYSYKLTVQFPTQKKKNKARKSIVSQQSTGGGQDEMQEELKSVLTLFRDKRRILDIVKTPEIYIQQSSSAAEVEQWLVAKGFTGPVVKRLHGFNGNELFALKRHTMEDYFGSEEGRRLASQITIQRNISGVSECTALHISVGVCCNNQCTSFHCMCSTKRRDRRNCRRFWPRHERRLARTKSHYPCACACACVCMCVSVCVYVHIMHCAH